MHCPQRYLERCLKSFGGGSRNGVPDRSWKGIPDKFDGFAHHVGKARSKTRVFKGLNTPAKAADLLVSCRQSFDGLRTQPFSQF